MSKRERIIQLVEKISALRAELNRLDREFAELVPEDVPAAVPTDSDAGQSMPAKVLAVFSANPTRVFEAQEVSRLIQDTDMHLIRSTLFRLSKSNKIRKLDRGKYGAMQTHTPEVAA